MAASYNGVPLPANGRAVEFLNGKFVIPDNPIIPFIEGDGTGRDIWKASVRVVDAAVERAYDGKRRSRGTRCSPAKRRRKCSAAGFRIRPWTPSAICDIGIKGPLTTPIGGGIRSLNVALRQILDLYCLRASGEVLRRAFLRR